MCSVQCRRLIFVAINPYSGDDGITVSSCITNIGINVCYILASSSSRNCRKNRVFVGYSFMRREVSSRSCSSIIQASSISSISHADCAVVLVAAAKALASYFRHGATAFASSSLGFGCTSRSVMTEFANTDAFTAA